MSGAPSELITIECLGSVIEESKVSPVGISQLRDFIMDPILYDLLNKAKSKKRIDASINPLKKEIEM